MAAHRKRGGGRRVTVEEERLWDKAMGAVAPLPRRPGPPVRPAPTGQTPRERLRSEPGPDVAPGPAPKSVPKPVPTPAPKTASRPVPSPARAAPPPRAPLAGLDKRNAQRLRRGQLPIEDQLDLHGRTLAQAHRTLNGFLGGAHAAGLRCVLVITGKGLVGRDAEGGVYWRGGGVLREEVPRWLSEPPNGVRVLAWHPAQPRHGGGGALYVLLRKHRL